MELLNHTYENLAHKRGQFDVESDLWRFVSEYGEDGE